jgi:hypothetical protein
LNGPTHNASALLMAQSCQLEIALGQSLVGSAVTAKDKLPGEARYPFKLRGAQLGQNAIEFQASPLFISERLTSTEQPGR